MKKLLVVWFVFAVNLPVLHAFTPEPEADGSTEEAGRITRRTEISAYLYGPVFIGVNLERTLIPLLDVTFSLGYGVSAGLNFHPFDLKQMHRWSPYAGIALSVYKPFDLFDTGAASPDSYIVGLYNPVGLKYIGQKGFTFSLEGALYTTFWEEGGTGPWFGTKIGYRF